MDLLSYDEVIAYLANGELKGSNPRNVAFLFFGTTVSNMFFVAVFLMVKYSNIHEPSLK
ncbi:hypothetical protein OIU83_01445 [Flavobacterium sp. LS1R49]|uniref:Uncharacterized protein n=1 Tax=Flavobacterium shii TaxID=2987687 RepID=A0A9X2ZA18_9FLAO|nr:hypothetical protein [Flavobacterium shii]MCV9926300.1 hypothetical protein [Flavobacterium shii]